jgi:hypothetical protein
MKTNTFMHPCVWLVSFIALNAVRMTITGNESLDVKLFQAFFGTLLFFVAVVFGLHRIRELEKATNT